MVGCQVAVLVTGSSNRWTEFTYEITLFKHHECLIIPIDNQASIILVDIQAVTYAQMTPDQKVKKG